MENEAKQSKKKNKKGRQISEEKLKLREDFYRERMHDIVVDGDVVPIKSDVFKELANICGSNVKSEY